MAEEDAPRDKAVRLFTLMVLLNVSQTPRSRADIFDKMGAFYRGTTEARERMFERDKKALRALGIVIDAFENTESGELLGYRLNVSQSHEHRVTFTPEESVAVSLASRLFARSVDAQSVARAALSVDALAGGVEGHWLTHALQPIATPPVLSGLVAAIRERRSVSFLYRKPGETPRERILNPWLVVAKAGHWYLCGEEVDTSTSKAFRLDRMQSAISTGSMPDAYSVPEDVDVATLVGGPGQELESATLLVRGGHGARIRRAVQSTQRHDDEWDECTVADFNEEGLARLVAEHTPHVQVVAPQSLVQRVEAMLARVEELYG